MQKRLEKLAFLVLWIAGQIVNPPKNLSSVSKKEVEMDVKYITSTSCVWNSNAY